MKRLSINVLLGLILLTVNSCYVSNTIGTNESYLDVEIIQTLDKQSALAWDKNYNVVRVDITEGLCYDGKKVRGKAQFVDTYTYPTKDSYKTVPRYTVTTQSDANSVRSLSVTIFQTLSKNEALAYDDKYSVYKLETAEDVYYDGKKYNTKFILIGTYTYEAKDETIKTVPVYMKYAEEKEHLKQSNETVVHVKPGRLEW